MNEKNLEEYLFGYLRKSLEKSFDEMKKEYGLERIPNTPETQENLKDITSEILKGER